MNKDEQNFAITKYLGWKQTGIWGNFWISPAGNEYEYRDIKQHLNFVDSLDRMHEAEKALPDGPEFYHYLEKIIGRDKGIDLAGSGGTGFSGLIAHATSKQRAEAFLRALELWNSDTI